LPNYWDWKAEWDVKHPELAMILDPETTPEDRYRGYLEGKLWDLSQLDRRNLSTKYAEEMDAFYAGTATLEQLARVANAIGIELPGLPVVKESKIIRTETPKFKAGEPVTKVTEQQARVYADFLIEREQRFGKDIVDKSQEWYRIKQEQGNQAAKAYLAKYPELEEYWEWKRAWEQEHPDVARIINPQSAQEVATSMDILRQAAELMSRTTYQGAIGTRRSYTPSPTPGYTPPTSTRLRAPIAWTPSR